MSDQTAIRLNNLTKYYGKQRGVVDLDLEVKQGEVFGYLGPNGAGKTTTIRLLLDLIRPSGGSASVLGLDARTQSLEVRQRVGYISGDPILYGNLTGREFLTYAASLRGGVDWKIVESLADRLESDLSRRIDTLSHGNRQKVAILHAFMHQPELLIIDEPTSGLDPLMQREFDHIVREAKEEGRTVFLSSHILSEVESLCDRIGIIRSGRLVTVESVAALKARAMRSLRIQFGGPIRAEDFSNLDGLRNVTMTDHTLNCEVIGSLDPLIKAAAKYEVVDMTIHDPSLEEVFLAYYGENDVTA